MQDENAVFAREKHNIADPQFTERYAPNAHLLPNANRWFHRCTCTGNKRSSGCAGELLQECSALGVGNHLTIVVGRSISAQPLRSVALILCSLSAANCTFDASTLAAPDGDGGPVEQIDADPGAPDADMRAKTHLLLSEIKTTGSGKEFVEIHNPTEASIDLSNYYIADTSEYAFVPGAFGDGPRPEVGASDFIARFPDGASIASGETVTMAVRPTAWQAQFGTLPDYRIGGDPTGTLMREAFGSSVGNLATLTDSGEGVALFTWDGSADLVVDIDLADLGPNTSEDNRLGDKSGADVDGPDSGTERSSYQVDLGTMTNLGITLDFGQSYHRLLPEDGHERHDVVGNGEHQHDETTEDIAATWGVETASPGTEAGAL